MIIKYSRAFRQVVHTHTHTYASVARQYRLIGHRQTALMPCGWEGSRRSGVALFKRHGLEVCLQAQGLKTGDDRARGLHTLRYI